MIAVSFFIYKNFTLTGIQWAYVSYSVIKSDLF